MNLSIVGASRRKSRTGSPRNVFVALGGVGKFAGVPASGVSIAGKGKNGGKKAGKLCRSQVGQCQAAIEEICAGDLECLALQVCCDFFATCDTTGALACVVTTPGA